MTRPVDPADILALAERHHLRGEFAQAENLCRQAILANSDNAEAWYLVGLACREQRKAVDAVTAFDKVLMLRPGWPEAYLQLGLAQASLGHVSKAAISFERAVAIRPSFAEAHHNLGVALAQQRQVERAIIVFRAALALRPEYAEAWFNLARALDEHGQTDDAISAYEEFLKLRPRTAEAHNSLGVLLARRGDLNEAKASFRAALKLEPEMAPAHNNLGAALSEMGDFGGSCACFERAIALRPDYAEAHKSHAMSLLTLGEFPEGWIEFEWRWQCAGFTRKSFPQPPWDGTSLPDKTILLYTEQGLGDALQFVRFARLVRPHFAKVILQCSRSCVPLLRTSPGVDECLGDDAPLPSFDTHLPLMSLPRVFGTTVAAIPAEIPYLFADPVLTERWRRELTPIKAFKVGIIWQGNSSIAYDRRRSMRLVLFAALARVPGVQLFSLQKGQAVHQLCEATGNFSVMDLSTRLDIATGAFMDTAAAMKHLDLVVSCDTATAHLAGALGVPVWVPLPYAGDWRWLLHREDCPWYPTMRLFRQPRPDDFDSVFRRMADCLMQRVRG